MSTASAEPGEPELWDWRSAWSIPVPVFRGTASSRRLDSPSPRKPGSHRVEPVPIQTSTPELPEEDRGDVPEEARENDPEDHPVPDEEEIPGVVVDRLQEAGDENKVAVEATLR